MTALVYVLLCFIWGSSWIAIKVGVSHAPPLLTASARFIIAVLILGGIALVRKYSFPHSLREALKIAYPGLYLYGLHIGLIYFAEQSIDSSVTAVLFGSFPFFVALLSRFRLRAERIHGPAWLGLVLGFLGVVVITFQQWQLSKDMLIGTLLALGGTFAAAHGLIVHKVHHVDQNIIVSATLQMSLGGIPLLLGAILFEQVSDFSLSAASVGSILYLAVFATVLTFLGYYWLLRKTSAVIVSLVAFVTPVIAIAIGLVFFDESMSVPIAAGTVLILSGIILVIRKPEAAKETTGNTAEQVR